MKNNITFDIQINKSLHAFFKECVVPYCVSAVYNDKNNFLKDVKTEKIGKHTTKHSVKYKVLLNIPNECIINYKVNLCKVNNKFTHYTGIIFELPLDVFCKFIPIHDQILNCKELPIKVNSKPEITFSHIKEKFFKYYKTKKDNNIYTFKFVDKNENQINDNEIFNSFKKHYSMIKW